MSDVSDQGFRQVHRILERQDVRAFEASYAPATAIPVHEHERPFFTYVVCGDYVEQTERRLRDCHRGTVVFHPNPERHRNAIGRWGTTTFNVEISPSLWSELTARDLHGTAIPDSALSGEIEWPAFSVWREFHQLDETNPLALDEAVGILFSSVSDHSTRETTIAARRLKVVTDFLEQQLSPSPRLSEVAAVAGVHAMHLAKMFRRRYGYSMGEFVRRQRIAWACNQLLMDDATISSIAVRSGFADHAHFTRTFRRVTGCTPSWYRDRARPLARAFFKKCV
jgi:AraC family transcriptional regulator